MEKVPKFVGSVPVESNSDEDGDDGQDDAEEDERSSFADRFDADVDDETH